MGMPANSSVPTTCSSHSLFPCTPSHRFEHEVRPAGHLEPAHVVADRDFADRVAHRGEDSRRFVDGLHHARMFLRRPVFGPGSTEWRSSRAHHRSLVAGRGAAGSASRVNSVRQPAPGEADHFLDELVVANPAARAALGKQEFMAGSGMMPATGYSSRTFGTPNRSTRGPRGTSRGSRARGRRRARCARFVVQPPPPHVRALGKSRAVLPAGPTPFAFVAVHRRRAFRPMPRIETDDGEQ